MNNKKNVLAIKERDLIFKGDSTLVDIKKGDDYEQMLVQLGVSDGINIEILEGLDTTQIVKVQKWVRI